MVGEVGVVLSVWDLEVLEGVGACLCWVNCSPLSVFPSLQASVLGGRGQLVVVSEVRPLLMRSCVFGVLLVGASL